VPRLDQDRFFAPAIHAACDLVEHGALNQLVKGLALPSRKQHLTSAG